jgi:HAD superfamily hydrolase (TIGR01490 family)
MDKQVIAIFDLDYTITNRDTYIAFLLQFLLSSPSKVVHSSWLPIAFLMHKFGLRDNAWLKTTFLRSIAGGATKREIESCTQRLVGQLIDSRIRPGAKLAIKRHRDAGDTLLMVTASFDFYAEKMASLLGFDDIIATKSEWDSNDRLTGGIDGGNCYGAEKLNRAIRYVERLEQNTYTVAYADHYSDVPLLEWVDRAVAVNPEPRLLGIALDKGFNVQNWG